MTPLAALFRRELRIAGRAAGGAMGVVFLLALVILVPFSLGPDLALLGRVGPAILWVGALLATLLGLDRLFQADLEDGSLDLLRLGKAPLELVILAKCAAHWLTSCVPLALASPLLGLLFAQEAGSLPGFCLSLLVGTPALTLIGAVGAAATVSLRRGGLLLSLLVMPLSVPVLIFGVAAADASRDAAGSGASLALLAATSLAALALAPFAAAAALRAAE
jgi:heme exporter protein B